MDFKTKKNAYNSMQGKQHFEADQALLKSIRPNNPFADKPASNDSHKEKIQREILWLLLDMVSIEKIEENRGVKTEIGEDKSDAKKLEAISKLKAIDFDNAKTDNNLVNELFDFFELKATGKKKTHKMLALKEFLATLPIDVPGTTEETTGPVAEGEQINTGETTDLEPATDLETEELKEENEELKNENEELQDKVEDLEDELEAEKKSSESQPASEQKN